MPRHPTHVREHRIRLGLTQAQLADRGGISRAAVSAIEQGRLTPSVDAALRLASALGCRVEDLFSLGARTHRAAALWMAKPAAFPARIWQAQVGGRLVNLPVETTAAGLVAHDRLLAGPDAPEADLPGPDADRTLVVASCDPAASLLFSILTRGGQVRPLGLVRSSGSALDLLKQGFVHLAGIHYATDAKPAGNREAVAGRLGKGHALLRIASWETGVAVAPGIARKASPTLARLLRPEVRWIGRSEGSGAKACQDQVLGRRRAPALVAPTHRAVAEALHMGVADAGVCPRLVAAEAGLAFVPVRREHFDLCLCARDAGDPRVAALVEAVRSRPWRANVAALPGYALPADSGDLQTVP